MSNAYNRREREGGMATDETPTRKDVIDGLLLKLPGVVGKKLNRMDAWFVNDRMFACIGEKGVGLRLPVAQATELQFSRGDIEPFNPGGVQVSREWVEIRRDNPADYAKDLPLLQAALEFVRNTRGR